MPTDLPETSKVKHIIRPDGTIRRATRGVARLADGEICVEADVMRQPGLWFYDFDSSRLVEYSPAQLQGRAATKASRLADETAIDLSTKAALRSRIDNQPADLQAILNTMLKLVGLDDV